jgi:hypothetical protein
MLMLEVVVVQVVHKVVLVVQVVLEAEVTVV